MKGLSGRPVTIVYACLRDGDGGSPTAVLDEASLTDAERRAVPVLAGTSHAVFVASTDRASEPSVSLRFFTSEGELPACGHGTVAALAFVAQRAQAAESAPILQAAGREFAGWSVRHRSHVTTAFDAGTAVLCPAASTETNLILLALGLTGGTLPADACVASLGRWRILVPVADRAVLADLTPDFGRLRDACDRLHLLGCYAYTPPDHHGRVMARMFAPSIGVPEDIANANSTACLAAHLANKTAGSVEIAVDMGDSLGQPATVTATANANQVRVGGSARIDRVIHLH